MIGSDAIEIAEARTGRVVGVDTDGYLSLGAPASAMTPLVVEERSEVTGREQLVVEERGENTDVPAAEALPEGTQENGAQIFFKDLKTRFAVVPEDSSPIADGPLSVTRRLEVGDGEEWELM